MEEAAEQCARREPAGHPAGVGMQRAVEGPEKRRCRRAIVGVAERHNAQQQALAVTGLPTLGEFKQAFAAKGAHSEPLPSVLDVRTI